MKRKLLYLSLLAFIFAGCGLWEDFTTYFNLYYNASDLFSQAEQQIKDQRKDPFVKFDAPVPGSASQLLDKVIEKCSKILQFNAKSSLVDDALLMIGKAFYYQKNYIKANRKFQELISSKKDSPLILEARLWEAKTYIALNNADRGLERLELVKQEAIQLGKKDIVREAYLEEIKLFLVKDEYEKALPLCGDFAKYSSDDDLNAKVTFQAGEILLGIKDFAKARQYYHDSYTKYNASYELNYKAQIQEARIDIQTGEYESALATLTSLKKTPKFRDFIDQTELNIGIAYIRSNKYDEAYRLFTRFDTVYSSSTQIGNARYVLAQMYEKGLKNYDSAYVYYVKAKTSSATAEYLPLINERYTTFNKYATFNSEYCSLKKQILYLVDTAAFRKDSIQFIQDSIKVRKTLVTVARANRLVTVNYLERTRDFDIDLKQYYDSETALADSTPLKKLIPPRRPLLPLDSLQSMIAFKAFDLGNILFTTLEQADSGYHYFTKILTDYSPNRIEGRTRIALASYYATRGDSLKADSLYRYVYDNYKTEKYVNEAAKKIGKPPVDFEYDSGKGPYLLAEKYFLSSDFKKADSVFARIPVDHPHSNYAAKAQYAHGYILENHLNMKDSAVVVYDSLASRYPATAYNQKIQPRLSFFKEEKHRIAQAIADSIKHIQDSIRTDSIAKHVADSLKKKTADSLIAVKQDSIKKANEKLLSAPKTDSIKTVPADTNIQKHPVLSPTPVGTTQPDTSKTGVSPVNKPPESPANPPENQIEIPDDLPRQESPTEEKPKTQPSEKPPVELYFAMVNSPEVFAVV
ncbi:MAG: hypothetical protein LWX56_14660 [Ignavibacteria bacterium]|nr:hypothetical protein [Ignavibacteria bacterium]